jgi:hypothetical protein
VLVGQCASCGAPASLGCTICGRTFCKNCLDADERLCADCLQGQRKLRGGAVDSRPPPSRRVIRRAPGAAAKD